MSNLNMSYVAGTIAASLIVAVKSGTVSKVGIEEVRGAVVGYLAAGPHILSKQDIEFLIDATLRKTIEKVG